MQEHFLDDLKTGDRFQSESYAVTEAAIIKFAREFDPQPFHLDEEAARDSVFKGLAASGWHTAAISMRLFVGSALKLGGGAVGLGVDEVRWPLPVRPGDTLRLESEVIEVRASKTKPNRGVVRFRNVTTNQNGEVVQTLIANALVPRRSARLS
jgi:acyl dehydratase